MRSREKEFLKKNRQVNFKLCLSYFLGRVNFNNTDRWYLLRYGASFFIAEVFNIANARKLIFLKNFNFYVSMW